MKFRISFIFLLIVVGSIFFTGLDFTHHAHNGWLYYQMIKEGRYMSQDPYFGSQITYAYGIPAYALAGLLWFFFDIHSISVIQALMLIITYIILIKWFKQDRWVSCLIFLNYFFTIFDAYPAHFSNFLFWIASYAYYNKKNWWPVALLISAFNHPYTLISSLFFVVKVPALVIPEALILSFYIIASKVFTQGIFIPIYTIFMGVARVVLNLLPILILTAHNKINIKDYKIVRDITQYKITIPTLLIILLICIPILITLTIYVLVFQPTNVVDFTMFEGIPVINGTLRVVDYLYLPSVFVLPYQGYNLEAGSFRENNPQHMVKTYWDTVQDYDDFLTGKNISYVLFCKMCNPQSNEKEMLEENHILVWQNDYYSMFSIS
ncbi:MAG: hypothetical protein JW791_05355 [Nanoarchaeota archaeon]|nr:hypothetical protein [Nanoarchaeota archaeon]